MAILAHAVHVAICFYGVAFVCDNRTPAGDWIVGVISVSGNDSTPTGLILKESGLFSGAAFNACSLNVAEANLMNLGLFEKVSIEIREGDDQYREVWIRVTEKKSATVATELTRLKGSWIVFSSTLSGFARKTDIGGKLKFDKQWISILIGEDFSTQFFAVKQLADSPNSIDFLFAIESQKDCPRAFGLYELRNGVLTICWRQDGKAPQFLNDKGQILLKLKRAE